MKIVSARGINGENRQIHSHSPELHPILEKHSGQTVVVIGYGNIDRVVYIHGGMNWFKLWND
jgi:hypothetical protein